MSNTILIKHGPGTPGDGVLQPYELGYDTTDKKLYIGIKENELNKAEAVSVGYAETANSATTATSASKVDNQLTIKLGDETKGYDGSTPQSIEITPDSIGVEYPNKSSIVDLIYPVGAQYVTSTNTNPGACLGGSWELVDKYLKRAYYSSNDNADIITLGSSTSSASVTITVDGHSVIIKCYATFTGAFLDTNRTALTINYEKIGTTRITEAVIGYGGSDDGDAVVIGSLAYTSGNVVYAQAVTIDGSSIPADTEIHLTFNANVGMNYILDEFCDKFYWQRIA